MTASPDGATTPPDAPRDSAPALDARRLDRRRRDRRRGEIDRRLPPGESWFGNFAGEPGEMPSGFEDDAAAAPAADSRFFSGQAQRIVRSGETAFERLYRSFLAARAVVGTLLLVLQALAGLSGTHGGLAPLVLCVAYGAQALTLWLLQRRRTHVEAPPTQLSRRRWFATIGTDLVTFSLLHLLVRNAVLNYDALLLLPVLMSAVLVHRRRALATAAAAALFLLGVAAAAVAAGGDAVALLTPAGLAGGGLFFVTLLAGELSARVAREERSARGSLELARQQAQLNRLVIEQMTEGVLVVDRGGRVRAANPAARLLLSADVMCRAAPFPLQGVEAWQPLVRAVERAFAEGQWPEAGRDVTLELAASLQRTLRLRVRFTRRRDDMASEDVCLIFVEDVLDLQARLRQEKLAAMGRVSAGIAHEIRNPLAAISQANALLAEDSVDTAQRRLTTIVTDNVERLKRIVDDVLEVAPGASQEAPAIDGSAVVGALAVEWATTAGVRLGDQSVLRVELPGEPLGAYFDPEHLRRVLVNLLDNAHRHGSARPGAVHLRLRADERSAELSVASDGAPIAPEVERYLFEPFFSTRSRGTGLGLYICRELCERYGARIDYRQHGAEATHRNEFIVTMRRAVLPTQESRLYLVS